MAQTTEPEDNKDSSGTLAKVSKHDFYFETPLYEIISLERIDEGSLDKLFKGDVDAYSAVNNIDTTYEIKSHDVDNYYSCGFEGMKKIKLTCKRKENDELFFFVGIGENSVVKIGQFPSLADLQFAEIGKKYTKHLQREDLKEFKKAIGLAAHGVGAGSFVYLRRIFEKLIDQTYTKHSKDFDVAREDYLKLRMDEKVELLKDHLPSQLVDMKRIFSILSSGIHNLSEQQCLAYFPALKLSIELIIDQKIENELREKRDTEARRQIAAIEQSLK